MADHLSDEEQLEALKRWWKTNGTALLLAILVAAGGWFGWTYWQNQKQQQAEQASVVYMAMLDAVSQWEQTGAEEFAVSAAGHAESLKKLAEDSYYSLFGALTVARLAVADGELDNAAAELGWVLEKAEEPPLRALAAYRLSVLEYSRGNSERALELLDSSHPDSFAAIYAELKGDILAARGDNADASAAYQVALDTLESEDARTRAMLELKKNELAPGDDRGAGKEES